MAGLPWRKLRAPEPCEVCKRDIKMMCQKNTGVCSETCRKVRDGEIATIPALNP